MYTMTELCSNIFQYIFYLQYIFFVTQTYGSNLTGRIRHKTWDHCWGGKFSISAFLRKEYSNHNLKINIMLMIPSELFLLSLFQDKQLINKPTK